MYYSVKIIDDEDYEKDNEYFFLEIGHPKKVASIDNNGRTIYDEDFSIVIVKDSFLIILLFFINVLMERSV